MICFHSLNYWYLQQHRAVQFNDAYGCDLLSFFELLIFTTTVSYSALQVLLLWFAFILWTTDIYNNLIISKHLLPWVVICFHSLNYWYLQQRADGNAKLRNSCDLLSFFELLIFTTTFWYRSKADDGLWFAFILWTTDIYNNLKPFGNSPASVVICFHSLNYWYLQQPVTSWIVSQSSCDLLSFFELLIFTTTKRHTFCYKS